MKRIIFIRKKEYGKRAVKLMLALFVFYVVFISFKLITITEIKACFEKSAGEIIYMLTLRRTEDIYKTLDYKKMIKNKKTMAEAVIDKVNDSISYYGYVKDNSKAVKLVVYDPNKIEAIKGTFAVEKEEITTISNADAEENGNTDKESDEAAVSVNANSVMRLEGIGNGTVYSLDNLSDFNFLLSNFYVVPKRASVLSSDLNAGELLSMDMSIEKNSDVPQILIYHTHSMEGFTDSTEGNFDTNIVSVGTYLAKLLSEGYGYNVIHCTESFDYVDGKLDRSKAYTYARTTLEQILADNPTIEVILDIHRDGVNENLHLISDVNGKQTSQIMFFNGMSRTSAGGDIDYLYNKYRKQNLAFSLQLKLLAEEYFPGFTRKNYLDAYQYNLDLRERSVLVEVGAQTNSLSEAKNAMEPLAALLNKILSGDGEI